MIIAHNNFHILELQLKLLDDERNDIYVHIDKKCKYYDKESLEKCVRKSQLFFVKRISVNWGGYSQIKCELNLLYEASRTYHDYYHMLSGVDFPLKSNDYICDFFKKYNGYQFINFSKDESIHDSLVRMQYYYFLQEYKRRYQKYKSFLLLNGIVMHLQKMIRINRLSNVDFKIKKGCNWFSITHDCALFILDNYSKYEKYFKYSLACDEIFIHTILYNEKNSFKFYSPEDSTIQNCLRRIDWNRGDPYTWRKNDFKELINAKELWARKFDETADIEIVNKIYEYIKNKDY
jgi:hypothetical protein